MVVANECGPSGYKLGLQMVIKPGLKRSEKCGLEDIGSRNDNSENSYVAWF